ncbi:putative MYND finger [Lyophyllum shimeji]|uniref:MYND finger n=1 Tax=Lyophyllum shimeji TaxID=47721 RepID=A0A9P3UL70_LYOSH|nr:putative MYND finger [Lyophyllum shimeji]
MSTAQFTMEAIPIVTVDSLATHAGLLDDGRGDCPDVVRSQMLKMQLGILQRKPRHEQVPIHHEIAAKYLPALVEKYRANTGALNSSTTLLNVISYTPYFVRFLRTPAGQGIAALQTKRTVQDAPSIGSMTADEVAEIGQFLSTLLVLQGIAEVDEADKAILIPKLKQWERTFPGRLASDTSTRCLTLLTDDSRMRPMMQAAKLMIEKNLTNCGAPGCGRPQREDGSDLMQCARCKSAVYCGSDHQKKAWPQHKALCFAASF